MPSLHPVLPSCRATSRADASTNGRARFRLAACCLALVAIAALGPGAFAGAQEIANGSLLVASPELADPNFSHSVVLVLRHDDNGAIGVVINRVTSLAPGKVFPEIAATLGNYKGTLYRVRLGPYQSLDDANRIKSALSQNGVGAAIIRTTEETRNP